LAGAFHHHPDGLKHQTCSICHSLSFTRILRSRGVIGQTL
jgi:hypothetical protein